MSHEASENHINYNTRPASGLLYTAGCMATNLVDLPYALLITAVKGTYNQLTSHSNRSAVERVLGVTFESNDYLRSMQENHFAKAWNNEWETLTTWQQKHPFTTKMIGGISIPISAMAIILGFPIPLG